MMPSAWTLLMSQLAANIGFISMLHGNRAPRPRALVSEPAGGPGRGPSSVFSLSPPLISQSPLAKWFPALATQGVPSGDF